MIKDERSKHMNCYGRQESGDGFIVGNCLQVFGQERGRFLFVYDERFIGLIDDEVHFFRRSVEVSVTEMRSVERCWHRASLQGFKGKLSTPRCMVTIVNLHRSVYRSW